MRWNGREVLWGIVNGNCATLIMRSRQDDPVKIRQWYVRGSVKMLRSLMIYKVKIYTVLNV